MGAATGATPGTGCAANNRVKLGLCFFTISFSKKAKAFRKMFARGWICLLECHPNCNGWCGKGICLNGSPLGGRTSLPAWNPVLLHLTFHSIPPFFILLTIGSWFGKAADMLTPSNLTFIFEGIGLLVLKSNF